MAQATEQTAASIIAALSMQQHPEGGWFVETFRDDASPGRALSTAIYYLLQAGERSRWHRVRDAAEVWHFYAGEPLLLKLSDGRVVREICLGADIGAGQRPQAVVPAGVWQAAEPLGAFALVGCTVAPGFEFSGFEMAEAGWEPGT